MANQDSTEEHEETTAKVAIPPLDRRTFLSWLGTAAVVPAANWQASASAAEPAGQAVPLADPPPAGVTSVTVRVNGVSYATRVDPRTTLLDYLRETLELTGTKKGCDHGQCGACTVHVNGRRINACLSLVLLHDGDDVTTIEGLGQPGKLHPMQAAFVAHDGFQCGYCTSGQIMSAAALLREPCGPHDADVKESMSGNICRCGAYSNIVAAIQEVRKA